MGPDELREVMASSVRSAEAQARGLHWHARSSAARTRHAQHQQPQPSLLLDRRPKSAHPSVRTTNLRGNRPTSASLSSARTEQSSANSWQTRPNGSIASPTARGQRPMSARSPKPASSGAIAGLGLRIQGTPKSCHSYDSDRSSRSTVGGRVPPEPAAGAFLAYYRGAIRKVVGCWSA
jgi:hypothetical protein